MQLELFPSLVILSLSIAITVLTAINSFYKNCFSYWKNKDVKYLKPSIPFGNASSFFFGKCSMGELFKNWYLEMKKEGWKHGGAYFCGNPVYFPIDADLIKKFMISDFLSFQNHGLYIDENVDPLSGHLFNMEGYKWKNLRAKFPQVFTTSKMKRNVVIMEKISKELVKRLDEYARDKISVDVKDVLSRFTTDIISACAFGMQSNTLKNENDNLLKESRTFFDYQFSRINNVLVLLVPRHILAALRFKIITKASAAYFMDLFRQIINQRKSEVVKRNDLADVLIDLMNETKDHSDFSGQGKMDPLTFNEFAAQMYIFFEAGFETSSSAQTFAIYELAANPEIQERLRKEINEVLNRHDHQVTYDAINEMEYLDRVVDETLRKYPIFPILPRLCSKDYQVPGTDLILPKGSFVMMTNFGIHHDPEYYPDPDNFNPDRFTSENKAKRPFCSYMPFGEGPRICVGKRFGLWQTKIGLVTLIKNYRISLNKKMKLPFSFDPRGLILKTKGDVWVDLEKIN